MLYQADLRGISLAEVVQNEAQRAASEPSREASWLYAREIVDGVNDHGIEIDEKLQMFAHAWSLDRMPTVDRAILRMAAWEILYNPDVQPAVAINEAIEIAKLYSTDESARFVNGVLGRIAEFRQATS